MKTYLIVDDEPKARFVIREHLFNIDANAEVFEASNVDQALNAFLQQTPDLIFLDVEMPKKNGFEFIQILNQQGRQPRVVFVSAFRRESYYVEAIREQALDSLKKPILLEDLIACIDRIETRKNWEKYNEGLNKICTQFNATNRLKINTASGVNIIKYEDILYCKANGNYTDIHLVDHSVITVSFTLKLLENQLNSKSFFRVHRSALINLSFLVFVSRKPPACSLIGKNGEVEIPVSLSLISRLIDAI